MAAKLNRKAVAAADDKFAEVTKAAAPGEKFRVYVTLDTGETHEMPQPYTRSGTTLFAEGLVLRGWWWGDLWFPPQRLKGIRTEVWA